MAWTAPRTWTAGELVTHTLLNTHLKNNMLILDTHAHDDTSGGGDSTLGDLVKATFTDATAPSAPGANKTAIYAVSTQPHYRAGGAGADVELADANDLHTQAHDTAHEPSGADTMAVDAVAGTGSLRTLGTGSTQAAAGNHTH